ncbi:DUF805 domain-containing protein [Enterobacteriaceae bacterium ESL0689]|nr:DUF805 domain-containing protein [Enterobacteriaceae bacterium ESL0689]
MSEGLWHCYWQGWRKTFVYQGSASRQEFWSFILGNLLVLLIIAAMSFCWLVLQSGMAMVWIFFILMPLSAIASLVLFLPILSLGIRRMHDIGYSGWWFGGIVLINLQIIPMVMAGVFYLLSQIIDGRVLNEIMNGISIILNILIVLSTIILIWLCCKPGKLKKSSSSSDPDDLK